MRLVEIEQKAKTLGLIDPWNYTRQELIRIIQKREGNPTCFATRQKQTCRQSACNWRPDCV